MVLEEGNLASNGPGNVAFGTFFWGSGEGVMAQNGPVKREI